MKQLRLVRQRKHRYFLFKEEKKIVAGIGLVGNDDRLQEILAKVYFVKDYIAVGFPEYVDNLLGGIMETGRETTIYC